MRILFDHQTFSQQLYGGISRYFCELVTGINKMDSYDASIALFWSNNVHLKEYHLDKYSYPFPDRKRLLYWTNQYWSINQIKNKQFDIYHATYYDPYFEKYIGNKPYIVTYYDMINEIFSNKYPELKAYSKILDWKRVVYQRAACLIAISERTKQDMIHYLNIPPERIHVIHLGNSLYKLSPFELIAREIKVPYLLYVGNRSSYKNFIPFLNAISRTLKRYKIRLICAGGGAFTPFEYNIIQMNGITNLIEQHIITDKNLAGLYQQAIAFVFPSFYEGFGLPILEAYACDCPCIVSDRGALPEIAGEAALYIDPDRTESISEAVELLIHSTELRNELIMKGRWQLENFSWQKTILKTLSVYESVKPYI